MCERYSIGQAAYLNGATPETFNFRNDTYYKLTLADGTALLISGTASGCPAGGKGCLDIYFDTNGNKEPNVLGRDIFYYGVADSGKVTLVGTNIDPKNSNWISCNPQGEGWACSAWVYYKENMDYLKCADELSWDGKDRC